MNPTTAQASGTNPAVLRCLVLATSLYRGLNDFCHLLRPLYLASLGVSMGGLLKIQSVHLLLLTFLDAPVSVYADRFNRKRVLIAGCALQWLSIACYLAVGFGIQGRFSLYGWLVLADFLSAFGRNVMGNSLDTIAIAHLEPVKGGVSVYAQYIHRVQRYSLILKFLATPLALLSAHISYLTYMSLSLIGYTLLFVPLGRLPNAQKALRIPHLGGVEAFNHLKQAAGQLLGSGWGRYALISTAVLGMLRQTIAHNWQIAIFAKNVKLSPSLALPEVVLLLIAQLGMAGIGTVLNERLRGTRDHRLLSVPLLVGALASLLLTGFQGAHWAAMPPIWFIHSSLDVATMALHRLFADSTERQSAYSIHMLLHAFGRFFTSLLFVQLIERYSYWHGTSIFFLAFLGFLGLIPLYRGWASKLPLGDGKRAPQA